ncbi:metastasis-associated protein MTA3 isoform X1 [Diabrotica virgifera virgifera]|uniref:Metastasis-associated protein MTA3 n=3 Tax=Diabrotica virgifera virgifera TaxID=50390 RepID=A0ABM5JK68_DIAVI|nr:metastasis-associated protein MTA3 isoform X1 [Diabrotica virgifera virgifera]
MAANMYRVGDYVYFEASSTSPYQIRRIEELNKTASGNVEAKVMCFYRRRDLPSQLIQLADKHQCALDESGESPIPEMGGRASELLSPKQRHQMKHRELFLSRQVETLPATHIRGKCSVTLFNETEALASYLNKDDMFFYCLVFDPTQKTLLADKGEIRVGSRYQCDVPPMFKETEEDDRNLSELETLIWTPDHNLSDRQIDQFLVVSRSVGTFARALDCSSSVKQPSLHMSAAAASRDITLFHAMDTLHRHTYNLSSALCSLVPSSGPVLCRDEMEEWSASEANLFEEALDKYGKDFNDIRHDFLPWKTLKNIIEYYYMWKTTDRYVQQKRVKAVEAESKLKQVYIPNYNKPNPAALNNNKGVVNGSNGSSDPAVSLGGKACESCNVTVSNQWYAWGPSHMQCRLCQACWQYWKKYGGLKIPTRFGDGDFENGGKKKSGSDVDEERLPGMSHRPHRCNIGGCGKEFKLKAHLGRHYATAHGLVIRSGSPRPIMKTRTAFYLFTTPITRISRRLCRHIMRPRHAARAPFFAINIQAVKQECSIQMEGKSLPELKQLLVYRKKNRGSVTAIATRLGRPSPIVAQWLILTDKNMLPQPDRVAFPKPPKAPDGSLLYERVPNKPEAEKIPLNNMSPSLKRRAYDEMNGMDSFYSDLDWDDGVALSAPPPTKRITKEPIQVTRPEQFQALMAAQMLPAQPLPRHIAQINGKPKIAHMTRTGSGRKQVISWMDAPDDVYFRATEANKKIRRQVTLAELRRGARKPWRQLRTKLDDLQVVVLD